MKIKLNVQNSFGDRPGEERNVIADLPGEDPNGIVLLTAHFDAWDPAQGANDNGCGVAAVLEAARILKLLNVRPKHTIRFAFFSGEEQSDLGSRAYVEQHKSELDRTWAVVNTDSGAQAPLGLQLYGRQDLEPATRKLLEPLAPIGANELSLNADFESDEESFMVVGVPVYSLLVEHGDYDFRHHTIIDTWFRAIHLVETRRDEGLAALLACTEMLRYGTTAFLASHHGRESGFSEPVMRAMRPQLVIISDGECCDTDATRQCRGGVCYGSSPGSRRRHDGVTAAGEDR